jgi:hypothetical protein
VQRGLRAAMTYATAVAIVLAIGGCGGPHPDLTRPSSPPTSAMSPALGVAAATTSASVGVGGPALCSAPQPAQLTPFPFNRDAARRDAMVGAGLSPVQQGYVGGVADFYGIEAKERLEDVERNRVEDHVGDGGDAELDSVPRAYIVGDFGEGVSCTVLASGIR